MEAGLAIAAGFFGGMFVTAAALWFHERRNYRTLEEVSEQLAELRTLGCEMAQGYLFGKPAPADVYGERPDERSWSRLARH